MGSLHTHIGVYAGGTHPKTRVRASSLLVATTDSVTVVQVGLWKWHTCHKRCFSRCSLRILTSLCLV